MAHSQHLVRTFLTSPPKNLLSPSSLSSSAFLRGRAYGGRNATPPVVSADMTMRREDFFSSSSLHLGSDALRSSLCTCHQRLLHSSSSSSSRFSGALSLASSSASSSSIFSFSRAPGLNTLQYRSLVTKIKSAGDFSALVKREDSYQKESGKEEKGGHSSSSSSAGPLKVVQFSASWCFPCKQISPVVEGWSKELSSDQVEFFHVDIDECQDLAEEYDISSVPTFLFFKEGRQIKQVTGGDAAKLRAAIDEEEKKEKTN